jgi:hypothetical protein
MNPKGDMSVNTEQKISASTSGRKERAGSTYGDGNLQSVFRRFYKIKKKKKKRNKNKL